MAKFYYINSYFSLYLDMTFIVINKDIVGSNDVFADADADLAAGYDNSADFDEVWATCMFSTGNLAAEVRRWGVSVGMCEAFDISNWTFIHEGNHTMDSIFASLGLDKYQFCHGIWAVPGGVGRDVMTNGQIVRNMMPANLTAGAARSPRSSWPPTPMPTECPTPAPPG